MSLGIDLSSHIQSAIALCYPSIALIQTSCTDTIQQSQITIPIVSRLSDHPVLTTEMSPTTTPVTAANNARNSEHTVMMNDAPELSINRL